MQDAIQDAPSRRTARLTVDDWIAAALRLLTTEGAGAIKVSRLCDELDVTKGSFYWHFTDVAGLMAAVAERCLRLHDTTSQQLARLADAPPRRRIEATLELGSDSDRWALEVAARTWADTQPLLSESVAALDEQVVAVAHNALRELGFDEAEAHARALTALYMGVGHLHTRSRRAPDSPDERRIFVDLLTRH